MRESKTPMSEMSKNYDPALVEEQMLHKWLDGK